MNDDAALLHRYAAEGSQDAFAELVRRHLDLVYHAALRQTCGDPHRAEDVAQRVFTDLARKASALTHRPLLVAWLHTATRHAAAELRRTELRRQAREQAAFAMNETELAPEGAADWERLRPLIDDALQSLGERDRAAVLLRFFENRSYAELSSALDVTEDAARVRVNRALEKLRATLARRGLVSTAAALGLALAQPAFAATPAGLAASVTTVSLSAAGTGAVVGATTGIFAAVSTAKIATLTAGAITLVFLGVAVYQHPPGFARASSPFPTTPALSPDALAALLHPARLSPTDADAALAAYLALPPLAADAPQPEFLERAARLRALLTILPAEHVAQLLATTTARVGLPEARLRCVAFTAWSELDAPSAARWAAALEKSAAINGNQRAAFAAEAALAWYRADFDAAYSWAVSLRPGLARHIGGTLLARLVLTDSPRALALARAGDLAWFDAVRPWIFDAWLDHDPAAAFRSLGAEMFAAPGERINLPRYLARWAAREPQAALEWFDTEAPGDANERTNQLSSIISNFADQTPPPDFNAFAAALTARAESGFGRDLLEYFLRTWMSCDSTAALRWLDSLPDASLREEILRSSFDSAAYEDPRNLFILARRLPANAKRTQAIDKVLGEWSQKDPDDALAWLNSPEGVELAGPDAAQVARIGALARQDPATALASWKEIASDDTRRRTAPDLARAWALTAPETAADWLFAQIPDGINPCDQNATNSLGHDKSEAYWKRMQPYWQHAYAYNQIASAWLARDSAGFVTWAENLPSADRQRSALYTLSWDAPDRANTDQPAPADRLALIATLRDPAVRDPLLGDYLRNWHRYDANAARRWAAEHGAEALLPATVAAGR